MGFGGGGGKCLFYFFGRGDFSESQKEGGLGKEIVCRGRVGRTGRERGHKDAQKKLSCCVRRLPDMAAIPGLHLSNLLMALFLMGCFPGDFKRENRRNLKSEPPKRGRKNGTARKLSKSVEKLVDTF